jgi:nitroimidazol reductase NimA-like FMN-containing flavoprotein (pyridoxamine 5'-phosphate oxidase superfamily)
MLPRGHLKTRYTHETIERFAGKYPTMPNMTIEVSFQKLLEERHIATLGTENSDGSLHLTAVWYLFENGFLYVATSSKTKKARNVAMRPKASLMVDARKPGKERGITVSCEATLISGTRSQEINRRVHSRYMSAAALGDPAVGPVFAAFDDVTIQIEPSACFSWDMAALDAQAFGGKLGATPGYMLPLD